MVAAINCEWNVNLCRDQYVNAFPTMKIYPPRTRKAGHAYDLQPLEMTPTSIRAAAADTMAQIAAHKPGQGWPPFAPINATTKQELVDQLTPDKPTLVIIEDSGSTVGAEVITS